MQVFINGEPRDLAEGTSVATLLESLAVEPRHVAVEVNLELVPRGAHAERALLAGDRLEVVTLVGGG